MQQRRRIGLLRRSSTDSKGVDRGSAVTSAESRRIRAMSATAKVPEGSLEVTIHGESVAGDISGATSAYRMIIPPLKSSSRDFTPWTDVKHQCVKEEERQGRKMMERVKGVEWKSVLKMGMSRKGKGTDADDETGDGDSGDEQEEDEDEYDNDQQA